MLSKTDCAISASTLDLESTSLWLPPLVCTTCRYKFRPHSSISILHPTHIPHSKMKSLSILAAILTALNLTHAIPTSPSNAPGNDSVVTCLANCPQTFCLDIWPQVGRFCAPMASEFNKTPELLLPQCRCS
jgi:hypothetical protein